MSVNKFLPHVLILPEDDANRQLANGFHLALEPPFIRRVQVLTEVGGWINVRDRFISDHVFEMKKYPNRYMVLLIDCDGRENRLQEVKDVVPPELTGRVFVLGVLSEPEALKQGNAGSYEDIGLALARDCRDGTNVVWDQPLLRHNANELGRLRQDVCPMLFIP